LNCGNIISAHAENLDYCLHSILAVEATPSHTFTCIHAGIMDLVLFLQLFL